MSEIRGNIRAVTLAGAVALALLVLVSCSADGAEVAGCKRDGVTLEDGLEVRDLECGSGDVAESGSSLTVDYTTRLADGTAVDEPRGRGRYTFRLGAGQVLAGWDEGLQGMEEGGVRRLVVPPELAYADAGLYPDVAPGETISYEIELLSVENPEVEES